MNLNTAIIRLSRHFCVVVLLVGIRTVLPNNTFQPLQLTSSVKAEFLGGSLSVKDRLEVFEKIWNTINEQYLDPNFNGVDWKEVRVRYRPLLENAKNDDEFYRHLKHMLGELKDAHTRLLTPQEVAADKQKGLFPYVDPGLFIYDVEGKPTVIFVQTDTDAAQSGILPGMTVRTVDDRPVNVRYAEIDKEVQMQYTGRYIRPLIWTKMLRGLPDTSIKLGLTRFDGSAFEVTVMRRTRMIDNSNKVTHKLLATGIVYLRFGKFEAPVAKELKRLLEQYKDAPGLILDLRANPGGSYNELQSIAAYFFNSKVSFGTFTSRNGGNSVSVAGGLWKVSIDGFVGGAGKQLYKNQMAILINSSSASCSEVFAAGMQENKRATIFGSLSSGSTNAFIGRTRLKGGAEFVFSRLGYLTKNGVTLEGSGVIPDRTIEWKIDDYRTRRDPILEAAEIFLKTFKQDTPQPSLK